MKIVHFPTRRVLVMLALSAVIFITTLSMGDGLHDSKDTHSKTIYKQDHTKWSIVGAHRETEMPSQHKKVNRVKFTIKQFNGGNLFATSLRRARISRIGRQKLKDLIWRRRDLPFVRRPHWNTVSVVHPWYDPRLYKKQLTNNKDLEVDDEPYIVLPPDNTINTKEEAFKLDDPGPATTVDPVTVASPKPTAKEPSIKPQTQPLITTTLTTPTTPATPLRTPTTLPPITTPLTTTLPTTLPTTPIPPPTTKPTEKVQVIAIQAGTPPIKRAFPTRAANINLNLEIGGNEDASQPEPHEIVPVTPTVQNIYTSSQQEEAAVQPTPQIIIAPMPAGIGASQNQQPQIIMAQPAQTPPQPQYVFAAQPTAQSQPQYVVAAPQPAQSSPQYVVAAPQAPQPAQPQAPIIIAAPPPPPPPVVYQQPVIQPVSAPSPVPASPIYLSEASPPRTIIAAPSSPVFAPQNAVASQPQVTVSASPPASITVNSPGGTSPMGDLNNMMMSSSLMGMPSINPFLMNKLLFPGGPTNQMGMNSLQLPMFQTPQLAMNQAWPSPLTQQLQLAQQFPSSPMLSSPLLSSMPQGYDPLLYSGLTGMFANAIRSSMIQPQPNALTSALAIAASQAQTRNQPPDLLTAALTQALAKNIQQGIQPISNAKLVQTLSQALSQVQPSMPPNTNPPANYQQQQPSPPPPPPPINQQQPPPLNQQQQPPLNQQQPPPRGNQQGAPYPQIQIPSYQVVPNTQPQAPPLRDTKADAINNNYSVNGVGKALASALLKAARKIADRNPRLSTNKRKKVHYRHHSRERERSFVPLIDPHSNHQTMNRKNTQWADDDLKNIFAMFRPFWKLISSPCNLRGYRICGECSG